MIGPKRVPAQFGAMSPERVLVPALKRDDTIVFDLDRLATVLDVDLAEQNLTGSRRKVRLVLAVPTPGATDAEHHVVEASAVEAAWKVIPTVEPAKPAKKAKATKKAAETNGTEPELYAGRGTPEGYRRAMVVRSQGPRGKGRKVTDAELLDAAARWAGEGLTQRQALEAVYWLDGIAFGDERFLRVTAPAFGIEPEPVAS